MREGVTYYEVRELLTGGYKWVYGNKGVGELLMNSGYTPGRYGIAQRRIHGWRYDMSKLSHKICTCVD